MDLFKEALNRLCKWRMVFASWQLGTREKSDPECQAVRDHREATILLRVEVTALSRLLYEKGIVTQDDLYRTFAEEAEHLNLMFEQRFPGIKATNDGIVLSFPEARETMKGWPK